MLENVISVDGIRKAIQNNRLKPAYLKTFAEKLDVSLVWIQTGKESEFSVLEESSVDYGASLEDQVKRLRLENELLRDRCKYLQDTNDKILEIMRRGGYSV